MDYFCTFIRYCSSMDSSKVVAKSVSTTPFVDHVTKDESKEGADVARKKPNKLRRRSAASTSASVNPLSNSPTAKTSETSSSGGKKHSLATVERSIAAKVYFEHYFDRLFSGKASNSTSSSLRTRRRIHFEQALDRQSMPDSEKNRLRRDWLTREHNHTRVSRKKMNGDMFKVLTVLGRGAFGTVNLVRMKTTQAIFAMKILTKEKTLMGNHESHVRAERDVLTDAAASDENQWIVKLFYTFQDLDNLYFVMEYLPGGDLLSLLIQLEIFSEEMACFYAAEMILGIEELHKLGYIHRDIKPDNFLIDARGHLKLADCGLATDFHWSHESDYYDAIRSDTKKISCLTPSTTESCTENQLVDSVIWPLPPLEDGEMMKKDEGQHARTTSIKSISEEERLANVFCHPPKDHRLLTWRIRSRMQQTHSRKYSVVGTNNYIAPEVLKGEPYDFSIDWWSLAVIVFEMLYGYPPFSSSSQEETRQKIVDWKRWLKFPSYITKKTNVDEYEYAGEASHDVRDFIRLLLCDKTTRMGSYPQPLSSPSTPSPLTTTTATTLQLAPASLTAVLSFMMMGRDALEIKKHAWFKNVNFLRISESKPLWIPQLSSDIDSKYFEPTHTNHKLPSETNHDPVSEAPPSLTSKNAGNDASIFVQTQSSLAAVNNHPSTHSGAVDELLSPTTKQTPSTDSTTSSESLLNLRKRLAFVGFTYRTVAGEKVVAKSARSQSPALSLSNSGIKNNWIWMRRGE